MNTGTRIWSICFGCAFTIAGAVFLGSSLPHTEFLRGERSLDQTVCTSGQRFGNLWTTGRQTLVITPGTRASIEEAEADGNVHYRMVIRGAEGNLYFGKTKGDREEAEKIVGEVNGHLRYGFDTGFTWEEDIWWWWGTPIALIAIAIGILVTGLALCTNIWVFDRPRGKAHRTTRCGLPLRSATYLLQDIIGCKIQESRDPDGDKTYNCSILFRDGTSVQMSTVSYPLANTERLDRTVDAINSFLALSSG